MENKKNNNSKGQTIRETKEHRDYTRNIEATPPANTKPKEPKKQG